MSSIKLSIIIPCYNAEPYIYQLLDTLTPQLTDDVEVILIDDGSKEPVVFNHEKIKVIRQRNSGISKTRNKGLKLAKGKYIWFIDADDLVSDNAISYVLNKIDKQDFDYMDLSWKSLEDNQYVYKLYNDNDRLPNPSACTRIFKRSFIGDVRFPEKRDAGEDEYFTRHLNLRSGKRVCATEYLYYYRTQTPYSNSKTFLNDKCKTKRIAYYFKRVTRDMTYLIDEFKKEDEVNEIFLLTDRNDIPELERYCQIFCPARGVRAMERRGEPTNLVKIIPKPYKTQVVLFTSTTFEVGGLETFIYSFCKQMSKYYDITVLYDNIATNQLIRLSEIVPVIKNDPIKPVICDTLIINRISDPIPRNIEYKQSIQMAHCIKQQPNWHIPQDRDYIVNVSKASKDSFGEEAKDGIVIHNLTTGEKPSKALMLISALRVGAEDKQGNDERCIKLANLLDKAEIKYIWLYFGNKPMKNEPANMHYCGLNLDIKPYIAKADYLVQLSGSEAFSYSLLESLECNTPVIVTPLAQNADMKIVDGENGYIVPFDVDSFDIKKIKKIPKFHYIHENSIIIEQWRKLLGNTKPERKYKPKKEIEVEVIVEYRDLQRDEVMKIGTRCNMKYGRALELESKGFVRCLE